MGWVTGATSLWSCLKLNIFCTRHYDCISIVMCMLCLLFPAEDPSVLQRCGDSPRSPTWRFMGRKRGRVCRRPSHLRSCILLRPLWVWVGYCRDVWWLQQCFLLCIPQQDSPSTRICKEEPALPTLPLPESLEPLWWWLQRFFHKSYEDPAEINTLTGTLRKHCSLKLKYYAILLIWLKTVCEDTKQHI